MTFAEMMDQSQHLSHRRNKMLIEWAKQSIEEINPHCDITYELQYSDFFDLAILWELRLLELR